MFSAKFAATILGILFIVMAYNATAQWSPGGSMVYMGDLNLAASSASIRSQSQPRDDSTTIEQFINEQLIDK